MKSDPRKIRWIAALLIGCTWAVPSGCNKTVPPKPKKPGKNEVVLRIGDYSFTEAEINSYTGFLSKASNGESEAQIRRTVFMDFCLPKKIVENLTSKQERDQAKKKADIFFQIVLADGGDLKALRKNGDPIGGKEESGHYPRVNILTPDVTKSLFDREVGEITPPIPTVFGVLIVGAVDEKKGMNAFESHRGIYTVFFPYSQDRPLGSQTRAQIQKLLREKPYIHPYYFDDFAPLFPRAN
jgi:hypothetical protein